MEKKIKNSLLNNLFAQITNNIKPIIYSVLVFIFFLIMYQVYLFKQNEKIDNRPAETVEYEGRVIGEMEAYNGVGDVVGHVGQGLYDWNTHFLAQESQPYSLNYGKEKFEEYFKFAFVRNPWDRFISLWVKFKEEVKLQEQFNGLFDLHID